jgi:general secretion pathway protein L
MTTSFENQLENWRLRLQTSPAGEFLRWWKNELLQLLPASLQAQLAHAHGRVLTRVLPGDGADDNGSLELAWFEGGSLQMLDALPLDQDLDLQRRQIADLLAEHEMNEAPRDLLLSREQVLSKRVQLPLAAESNLRQALAFEMDRHTPFNAEAVYFDYQVLERDRERSQLHLDLVVAPRPAVDELLAVLEPRGLAPTGVDVLSDGVAGGFNLLPLDQRTRIRRQRTRINILLACTLVLVLALVMAQSLWLRQQQIENINLAIDEVRVEARRVQNIRAQIDDASEAAGFLLKQRSAAPPTVKVLAEATRLMPDNTYLDRLRVWEGNMQLQGKSANAQQLIEIVNASELFDGTEFRGSTRLDSRTGKEIFDLRADLAATAAISEDGGTATAAAEEG